MPEYIPGEDPHMDRVFQLYERARESLRPLCVEAKIAPPSQIGISDADYPGASAGLRNRTVTVNEGAAILPQNEFDMMMAHEVGHLIDARLNLITSYVARAAFFGVIAAGCAVAGPARGLALGSAVAALSATRLGLSRGHFGASKAAETVHAVLALIAVPYVLMQKSVIRHFENRADAHSLRITRDPSSLISLSERLFSETAVQEREQSRRHHLSQMPRTNRLATSVYSIRALAAHPSENKRRQMARDFMATMDRD